MGALVVVGRFGAPYGLKGWLRFASFTDPVDNILTYRPWRLHRDERWQKLDVDAAKAHGNGFVAHVLGVDDRGAAGALSGCEIGVPEEALPAAAPDEYYWKDLIGLDVAQSSGVILGVVKRLFEAGTHDVMVVNHEGAEVLIPFAGAYVLNVDLQERRIVVDWDTSY